MPCPASLGGGCYPQGSTCSLNGCLTEFLAPPRLNDDDDEGIVRAEVSTAAREEEHSRTKNGHIVTHTGPKFGELAALFDEDDDEAAIKTEQDNAFITNENSDEGSTRMVVKAEESVDILMTGEDAEETSSVTIVKGKGRDRGKRTSSSNSTDWLRSSQPSNVPLPRWVSMVLPAMLLDAIFLLR